MTLMVGQKHEMARYRTRLKELMMKHGKSRMDIVREAGFSYPTVVRWETQPLESLDAAKVRTLMELFGVSYEDLVYIDESPAE